jgi:hypothetical protein
MAKKIILKENGLVGSSTTASGYKFIGDNDGNISQKIGATVSGIGLGYKVYTALLTQTGTNAPTAIVLENTIGNIVWTRNGTGSYDGTLAGAFTESKTAAFISIPSNGNSLNFQQIWRNTSDVIRIQTYNGSGTGVDGRLAESPVEIRVYN